MIDLTGQQFERLTVVDASGKDTWGNMLWLCRCSCGKVTTVSSRDLRSGDTKSCGCLKKEVTSILNFTHGAGANGERSLEYRSWLNMKQRCSNPHNKRFTRYGGRGIRVCARWLHSFPNFLADMGRRPAATSIERIDNNGNYEPGNCRWATTTEQNRNTQKANIHKH